MSFSSYSFSKLAYCSDSPRSPATVLISFLLSRSSSFEDKARTCHSRTSLMLSSLSPLWLAAEPSIQSKDPASVRMKSALRSTLFGKRSTLGSPASMANPARRVSRRRGSCAKRVPIVAALNTNLSPKTRSLKPVLASSPKAAVGSFSRSVFSISSVIRSAETISSRSPISLIALTTSSVGVRLNCATKRAALSIRRGSSLKDSSADKGVASTRSLRADAPSKGSTSVPSGSFTAMALIVKSLRARSSEMSLPNTTAGLRESWSYASLR